MNRVACLVGRVSRRHAHSLPKLSYDFAALAPVISAEIMELHYSKHHATYVNNYNAAEEKLSEAVKKGNINDILTLRNALSFNGGGHLNHSIFWQNLSPKGGGVPSGPLAEAINKTFGSFDKFKEIFSAACVGVQGSGWGWLGFCKSTKQLRITTCANQDPLQPTTGLIPLLGIDVWEHAYYLDYKNVRPAYVKAIWDVVNWQDVSKRYKDAQ